MAEPQQQRQTLLDDEATLVVSGEETTLVTPRFDSKETRVARPVVPLERDAHALPAQAPPAARPAHDYRSPYAPRRSGMLALALVSVLIGGVLGGAGLYLYQRQSQEPAVTTTEQPVAPADAAQVPAAPAVEVQNTTTPESPAQPTEAPAAVPSDEETAPPARDEDEEVPAAAPAREPESVPAAERRTAPSEGTPKRGKKGNRDEEIERRTTPRPDGNVARADEPEARQVDTIFYRQRRAERQAERRAARRARRAEDVDRLRRIFEGTPQ